MNKYLRLRAPFILLLLLLFCLLPALPAGADSLGERIDGYDAAAAGGLQLSRGVYWTGSDYRTENYVTYSAEDQVFPMVVYGSKVLNYGDFPTMAALLEKRGYTVLAGINGDYYNTADYQPLGIVITDGLLRSSDGGHWAVGFRADGSALIGKPELAMTLTIDGADYGLGAVNKARGADYFVLYTADHSYTTQAKTAGRNAILRIVDGGELTADCHLTLEVEQIVATDQPLTLEEGKLVLSLAESAHQWRQQGMDALAPGDTLTLTVGCAPGWEEVQFAVGSLYKLVTDGQVEPDLDNTAAPRTAVGVKANGELVLYTVDGRQSGHSVGAGMTQVAERLLELGCVEATLLDGGGSTTLNAIYGGESAVAQINRPSDGKQRSVTNYIMLVSSASGNGAAQSLCLYPLSLQILSGAEAQFTALAMDKNGLAAGVPRDLAFSVDGALGSVDADGLFRAAGEGQGELTVSADGVSPASVPLRVVMTPDSISVSDQATGTALASLDILAGERRDLTAAAMANHLQLVATDTCFTWTVEGGVGQVDANGVFTAGDTRGSGQIMVSAGAASYALTVNVKREYTFDDVLPGDWCFSAVEYVAGQGLLTGTDSHLFSPRTTMSRGMIVTALHRAAGLPAGGALSFSDVPAGQWYSDAVAWVAANGIVTGYDDGTYAPQQAVTREQIAGILYRYAASIGRDVSAEADLSGYADAGQTHEWALPAMRWAVAGGIIGGRTDGSLDPRGNATRAEVAAMLTRFLQQQ